MSLQLIGTNKANSTLLAYDDSTRQVNLYSAFGSVDNVQNEFLPGFNGERADPLTGGSHLGNGYRTYNPILMRFTCPDNESPFGAGGINPYAYCQNDPVNFADPNGHGFLYRLVKRGLRALFRYFLKEEMAKAMGKIVAKTAKLTVTYGTQIISAVTTIDGYEDTSEDPQKAIKLEKVGKAFGLINAVVTIINNPMDLVNDFTQITSRSGAFVPEEAVNESLIMASSSMKSLRKMENAGSEIRISIKDVTTTATTDELIRVNKQFELGDIDENLFHRLKHGIKDAGEAFASHDFDTVEDLMQHDNTIRTRPTIILNITKNTLGLASTGFSIEAYSTEKIDASSSEELYKIADYLGFSGDIMDISGNIQRIIKYANRSVHLMYEGRVILGTEIL